MEYYHVCTDALTRDVLFHDDEDYIVGLNYIAVGKFNSNVKILAFCIMSNHIHLIMKGDKDEIRKYVTAFKRRYSMWLSRKYNERKCLKYIPVMISMIDNDQSLKNAIAYVLRNPVAARLNVNPYKYRWSSASCYFGSEGENPSGKSGYPISSFYRIRRVMRSRKKITGPIMITADRTVDVDCFVDKDLTESLYRTLKAFLFYMSKDNDTELEYQFGMSGKIIFSDNTVLRSLSKICNDRFNVQDVYALSVKDRCSLVPVLKRNFNSSVKQIARLLNLDPEIVKRFY